MGHYLQVFLMAGTFQSQQGGANRNLEIETEILYGENYIFLSSKKSTYPDILAGFVFNT